jgi:TonB-dependent receptor
VNRKLSLALGAALWTALPALAEEAGSEAVDVAPPGEIEEVIVLGKFVPDEKRDTSEISNLLDTEALDLLTDSSVGEALSRVTGLSLVGGKYVYVRGLGERYSSSLLNGSRISSPVPFQKTVPLDIVPKSIIESLLVQKTYSAQYPGDFSGGVVDMRTKSVPDENYLSLEISTGGNGETTWGNGLNYKGGADDFWGYDDGTRLMPDNIRNMSSEEFEATPYPQKLGLGNSFYNLWEVRERDKVSPDVGAEGELGRRFELDNGMVIGVLVAARFDNEWRNRDKDLRRYEFSGVEGDTGTQTVDYQQFTTTNTVELSGFGNLGIEFTPDHSVTLSSVALRQTTDETQQSRGLSSEDDVSSGTPVESYRYQWTENEILSHSVSGEHYFSGLNDALLTWRYVNGKATRQSPDTRTYTYAENTEGFEAMVTPSRQAAGDLREVFQAPDRNYARLRDDIEQYGVDVDLPLSLGGVTLDVKAGWSEYERTRETKDRLFRFELSPSAPSYVALMEPRDFFATSNWASGALRVNDFSARAANASGIFPFAQSGEDDTAFYVALDAQLMPRLRVQAGVRDEDTTLFADAWGGNTEPGTGNAVKQKYSETLPSASLTWEFINDMQIRVAYSETVNRPSLTEITGNTIRNPEDDRLYRGNVFLEPAAVTNYDVRWEWYFGAADSMSIGYFKKDIEDPIELGKVQAQNDIYTWFNADEASLEGVEFEIVKDLPFSSWFGWSDGWEYFGISANVSYIDSEVTLLAEGETAADVPLTGGRRLQPLFANERPITGQSDWLGNLMLTYTNFESGLEGSLSYNYTDDRVVLVGERNNPDIVEKGRGKLDLLLKYYFEAYESQMEIELKVENLLDEPVEWRQGPNLYEEYDIGISYSLAFKMSF